MGPDGFLAPGHILAMRKTYQTNLQDRRALQIRCDASAIENFPSASPILATDTTCLNFSDGNVKQEMPDCFMGFDVAADVAADVG